MQALYRKWRPQTFSDVVGQEAIVQTLQQALRGGHIHHAYLFAGPRGTGKTTLARLVAKAVNCLAAPEQRPCGVCAACQAIANGEALDLYEIDAASHTGVDNIREILDKVALRPAMLRYKVYIIDEVHMLSTAAFNALLKTLEEPPEHVIFIMATTEAHKIPATVLSRCQRFEFRRLALTQIVGRMQAICAAEGLEAEPEALDLIARAATGSLRDALTLLDQASAHGHITFAVVRAMLGAERREVVTQLAQAWVEGDLKAGLETINRAVDAGADPRQLARQLTDLLRGLLLIRMGAGDTWQDISAEERPLYTSLAQRADPQRLTRAIRIFSQAAGETRTAWHPQLPLELAFAEATLAQPQAAPFVESSPAFAPAPVMSSAAAPSPTRPAPAAPVQTAPAAGMESSRSEPSTVPGSTRTDAPTAQGAAAEGSIYAEAVTRWSELFAAMRKLGPQLQALYRDARPLGSEPGIELVIGFRYPIICQRAAQEANRQKVEQFMSSFFGRPVRIKCVELEKWQPTTRSAPTPAQPTPRPSATTPTTPRPPAPTARPSSMPPDPMDDEVVRRAMDELGAVPDKPL